MCLAAGSRAIYFNFKNYALLHLCCKQRLPSKKCGRALCARFNDNMSLLIVGSCFVTPHTGRVAYIDARMDAIILHGFTLAFKQSYIRPGTSLYVLETDPGVSHGPRRCRLEGSAEKRAGNVSVWRSRPTPLVHACFRIQFSFRSSLGQPIYHDQSATIVQ